MTRRVPVVVHGAGPLVDAFGALLAQRHDDVAGVEGLDLQPADEVGPGPSVVVDAGGAPTALLAAARAGHAVVAADLAALVERPVDLAVLLADRRLRLSAALLPGLPLVHVLMRERDAAHVEEVVLDGAGRDQAVDEAVCVAALLGLELTRSDVRVDAAAGSGGAWRAVVGTTSAPRVTATRGAAGARTVTVRSRVTGDLDLSAGAPATVEATARALLGDVLELAREADTPWRAHRRVVAEMR
jgi:homoserine dehydrogenase